VNNTGRTRPDADRPGEASNRTMLAIIVLTGLVIAFAVVAVSTHWLGVSYPV
jgi:hypothetical protein